MGYRSDVAYIIQFEDSEAMGQFITYVAGHEDKALFKALRECMVDFDNYKINFFGDSVKWYPSYPDVKAHTDLMHLVYLEDTPFFERCDFRFIRIGEETEDIEEDCSCGAFDPDDLYVQRSIDTPFDQEYVDYGDVLDSLIKEEVK